LLIEMDEIKTVPVRISVQVWRHALRYRDRAITSSGSPVIDRATSAVPHRVESAASELDAATVSRSNAAVASDHRIIRVRSRGTDCAKSGCIGRDDAWRIHCVGSCRSGYVRSRRIELVMAKCIGRIFARCIDRPVEGHGSCRIARP
jgi:hypothetical protein